MGLDQYFTPPALARRFVEWCQVKRANRVVEPSAGYGKLVEHIPKNCSLTAYDIDPLCVQRLESIGRPSYKVERRDFLSIRAVMNTFDLAIMNPPYSNNRDLKHVLHASRLAPRVCCLVRSNFLFGVDRYLQLFRWVRVTRQVIIVNRPDFPGPSNNKDTSTGPRHDFTALELVRRDGDRLKETGELDGSDEVLTEWWYDNWR